MLRSFAQRAATRVANTGNNSSNSNTTYETIKIPAETLKQYYGNDVNSYDNTSAFFNRSIPIVFESDQENTSENATNADNGSMTGLQRAVRAVTGVPVNVLRFIQQREMSLVYTGFGAVLGIGDIVTDAESAFLDTARRVFVGYNPSNDNENSDSDGNNNANPVPIISQEPVGEETFVRSVPVSALSQLEPHTVYQNQSSLSQPHGKVVSQRQLNGHDFGRRYVVSE